MNKRRLLLKSLPTEFSNNLSFVLIFDRDINVWDNFCILKDNLFQRILCVLYGKSWILSWEFSNFASWIILQLFSAFRVLFNLRLNFILGCLFTKKWHLQAPTLSALLFNLLSKELISLASTDFHDDLSWSVNFIQQLISKAHTCSHGRIQQFSFFVHLSRS